jgi:hypothetical protein
MVMCIFCSKFEITTNIANITGIHTYCFYNNKHTYTTANTKFTTKHKQFIKTNIGSVTGPKCYHIYMIY